MKISKKRRERYEEKLGYAEESLLRLRDWLPDADKDEKSFIASTKAFQEYVEALTDVFAMIIKDEGLIPKDDYSNIEKLLEKGVLSDDESNVCKELNGLRNVVIHKYNSVDKSQFIENANTLLKSVVGIIKKVGLIIENGK